MLKWLRENGCLWDESTTDAAVYNKDNKTLNWALENGCPFSERTLKYFIKNNDFKWFQQYLEVYQEVSSIEITKKAIEKGNLDIIKLLHEKNATFPDNSPQTSDEKLAEEESTEEKNSAEEEESAEEENSE